MTAYIFFFNDTATTEIYTLSLHDALPIWRLLQGRRDRARLGAGHPAPVRRRVRLRRGAAAGQRLPRGRGGRGARSEEHTSELQSRQYIVCRLLLEKKKSRIMIEKHT